MVAYERKKVKTKTTRLSHPGPDPPDPLAAAVGVGDALPDVSPCASKAFLFCDDTAVALGAAVTGPRQ